MATQVLVVDCGNTRYKFLQRDTSGCLSLSQPSSDPSEVVRAASSESGVLLAAGAPRRLETLVTCAYDHGWSGAQVVIIGDGLPLPDMGQYAGCGVDRCCAGLAAARDSSVIVCDFGTATTITAWAQGPVFTGGLILPGYAACSSGLHYAAPALPNLALESAKLGDVNPLAHDTRSALQAGMAIGYPGMVAACLQEVQQASGIEQVVASGGGLSVIPARMRQGWRLDRDLVLRGMLALYDQARSTES